MSKQTVYSQYRLEVLPEDPSNWQQREISPTSDAQQHRQNLSLLADLRASIRKHCDGVLQVIELFDKKEICTHCLYPWEDDPGCCDKAIADWESSHPRLPDPNYSYWAKPRTCPKCQWNGPMEPILESHYCPMCHEVQERGETHV